MPNLDQRKNTRGSSIFLKNSLKSFLLAGDTQSTSFLPREGFEGFKVSTPGAIRGSSGGTSQLDKLAQVFEKRRRSIQRRVALPGRSIFLSGR